MLLFITHRSENVGFLKGLLQQADADKRSQAIEYTLEQSLDVKKIMFYLTQQSERRHRHPFTIRPKKNMPRQIMCISLY